MRSTEAIYPKLNSVGSGESSRFGYNQSTYISFVVLVLEGFAEGLVPFFLEYAQILLSATAGA